MLRKSLSSKKQLKEKIVALYSDVIKEFGLYSANNNFWDEFFLLRANPNALILELKSIENKKELTQIVNNLFAKCLEAACDSNQLRISNALITLCSISHYVLHVYKSTLSPSNFDDLAYILLKQDEYDVITLKFSHVMCNLLASDVNQRIKSLVLRLYLILFTSFDDIDKNSLLEHLMYDKLFDSLIDSISSDANDNSIIMFLMVLLLNYKKQSANNIFVIKLSIVDNEACLSGYSKAILTELVTFNKTVQRLCSESKSLLFSTFTNMVGTLFSSSDHSVDIPGILGKRMSFKTISIALLAFYEAILLNRNFISLLLTAPLDMIPANDLSLEKDPNLTDCVPVNLLIAFLEFTSIIMFDLKDETTLQMTRLCLIIVTCITEDACANSIIHDQNLAFQVNLQKMPMRHRKVTSNKAGSTRPICHALLDLLNEFIATHLNRNIQQDLFLLVFGIIHRLICYQKRCRVRIDYCWKDLWLSLILLIKFFLNNESYLLKHGCDIFLLSQHIVNLFNFFILYADNFLASTAHYDELYYEIVRMHTVFNNLNTLSFQYMKKGGTELKESARKLNSSLINIKAIIAHLNGKIELCSNQNQTTTLSEEQVMDVVQHNYDSITLKFQENLDQFKPYNPIILDEISFFNKIIRYVIQNIVNDKDLIFDYSEQYKLIQEIQNITLLNSNTSLKEEKTNVDI